MNRCVAALAWLAVGAVAQAPLQGTVTVRHLAASNTGNAGVVVWLTADDGRNALAAPPPAFRMAQKDKRFAPHLLVVPVGATVTFPNFDPFFHNVFSLGDARPFDLGLYQAGGSRAQVFSRPGVSYVFCNLHPQMSAVIVTLPSRWYAVTDAAGAYRIPAAPPGAYHMHVWYEHAHAAELAQLEQAVEIKPDAALPTLEVHEIAAAATHKNKYGKDYDTAKGYGPGGGAPPMVK